jgi:hypothetical protein
MELSADRTEVGVGDSVLLTIQLKGAEAFSCWGACAAFDRQGLAVIEQGQGDRKTFVRDSRGLSAINETGMIRLGGYEMSNQKPSSPVILARLALRGQTPGIYKIQLMSDSQSPFGAVLHHVNGGKTMPALGPIVEITVKGTDILPPRMAIGSTILKGQVSPPSAPVWVNGESVTVDGQGRWAKEVVVGGTARKIGIETEDAQGGRIRKEVSITP